MYELFVVDAFVTKFPFSGNPASVCILDCWKSDIWMQAVANEINHSETAFVLEHKNGFAIRYFTPSTEVPLCGHATFHMFFFTKLPNKVHQKIPFTSQGTFKRLL